MTSPTPAGSSRVSNVSVRGLDVTNAAELQIPRSPICNIDDLKTVLAKVSGVYPCVGIRKRDLPECGKGFGSVVTNAVRTLHSKDAADVAALGLLEGFQEGEVAATLHAVGDEHVLWSSRCSCFVSSQPRGVPILCGPCATYRASVARAAASAASKEYNPKAPNRSLYTPAKAQKLADLAKDKRELRRAKHRSQLNKCRVDDVVINGDEPQGQKLFDALEHPEVKHIFRKLPEDSLAKAILDENREWNLWHGSSKGWRFNEKVLRWSLYALARIGSAGYEILREILHLPTASHVRKLRGAAAPIKAGIQRQNIKAYGKMAATDDASRFDLMGFLVWDLMHINSDGFTVMPNGGPISGCVDEHSFFNPIWAMQGVDESIGLEKVLDTTVATQYLEVFWVSIGNPKYKFVVWREACRGLQSDYILTMLDECMLSLWGAHEDKAFDVVATICDGAPEHRTAQKDNAKRTFGQWAKPDDKFEQSFADFPIAFNHPHHGGPVFNISDPPHLIKKLVNSLWYSDMETKDRKLGKLWPQPTTGELEWCEFSLKTLEKVYFNEELGGGALSRAEQAAMLQRFSSMKPDQFKRDSRSCMDVGLSMKNLSLSAVRACNSAQAKLLERGLPPNGNIACYAEMAFEVNDLADIFNGVYGRNKVDVKKKIDVRKSCITAGNSPLLDRLLEILGWFETWRRELEPFFPGATDIQAFITRECWFDMQLAILGFVALSRYLFSDESLVDEGGRRRYLFPRDFSQDICEHRFGHIRAGQGTHKNPRKEHAFGAGARADLVRAAQQSHRRSCIRGDAPHRLDLSDTAARATMPINAQQRRESLRAYGTDKDDRVLEARSLVRRVPQPSWEPEELSEHDWETLGVQIGT